MINKLQITPQQKTFLEQFVNGINKLKYNNEKNYNKMMNILNKCQNTEGENNGFESIFDRFMMKIL